MGADFLPVIAPGHYVLHDSTELQSQWPGHVRYCIADPGNVKQMLSKKCLPTPQIVFVGCRTFHALAAGASRFARQHTHERCKSLEALRAELARIESLGGEGLMLRQPGSKYVAGRSMTLLKVKTFHDAEATVIGHQPGAGRHKGRMGALLVRLSNGTDFAIGTGFSDRERENPPALGSTVTFRYQELSEGGVPRFPSWVGVRLDAGVKPALPMVAPAGPKAPGTQVTIISPGSSSGKPRYFEFVQGASSRFWEVSQTGSALTTRWGRIGSNGQSKTTTFADEPAAAKAMAKLIKEKTVRAISKNRSEIAEPMFRAPFSQRNS